MKFTEEQLVPILSALIDENKLRENHGEDTIGVLMKCGAFRFLGKNLEEQSQALVELCRKIELGTGA